MENISKCIVQSFCSVMAVMALCCLPVFTGCDFLKLDAVIAIDEPDNGTSFEDGESISFAMRLIVYSDSDNATIYKGTILQWTSSIDGPFWEETIDHDITGKKESLFSAASASYSQSFSTFALSVGNHTITCKAIVSDESGIQTIASESIRLYITASQGATTTTTAADGGGGGEGDNQSIAECSAMDRITLYAGAPEMYGNDCYANLYVKNKTDECVNVISCQYDTHDSEINGCWNSSIAGGAEIYLIDSGWITATMSDGSKRTRKTTDVWAYNCSKECAWIGNDLYNRVIDLPIPTTDVEGMNPCN